MLKKKTWRKLFTRNKSKNRDSTTELCNLCVGMTPTDINSLCDRHRNTTEAPKSPGILKDSNDSARSKTFRRRSAEQPPVSVTSPPRVENEAVVEPAETGQVQEPGTAENQTTEKVVAQTKNESAVKPDLEPAEILKGADSVAEKLPTNPGKLDKAATNEEFMTEEVDSPSSSENSHTENAVPIVIEPEEHPKRESEFEDSQLKRRISFQSSKPTKIVEIPSKEEMKEAIMMVAAEENSEIQEEPKKKYSWTKPPRGSGRTAAVAIANQAWFGTDPKQNRRLLDAESHEAHNDHNDDDKEEDGEREEDDAEEEEKEEEEEERDETDGGEDKQREGGKDEEEDETQINEEQTKAELVERIHERYDHTEVETHEEGTHGNEESTKLETKEESSHEREEHADVEAHKGGTTGGDDSGGVASEEAANKSTYEFEDTSKSNDLRKLSNSDSVVINPTLSEPTPLSSHLPNVFFYVPKILEYPTSAILPDSKHCVENEQNVVSQLANPSEKEHIIETADSGSKTYAGAIANSEPESQEKIGEQRNIDEGSDEQSEDQDGDYYLEKPSMEYLKFMNTTTFMDINENATKPPEPLPLPPVQQIMQADHISDEPIFASDDHTVPSAVMALTPPSASEQQSPRTDRTSARMVFGTVTSDFSNQPLFFSPNFAAQRTGPNADHSDNGNNPEEEPQFPHYSIYDVMKNFMKTLEPSEEDVGRVTEVTDPEPWGARNPQKQQLEDPEPGHSPPSLEAEDEFEPNSAPKKKPEEQKELKKE